MKRIAAVALMMAAWGVALSARSAAEVPVLAEFPRDMASLVTALNHGKLAGAISADTVIADLYAYNDIYDVLTDGNRKNLIARVAVGGGDTIDICAGSEVKMAEFGLRQDSLTVSFRGKSVMVFSTDYDYRPGKFMTDFICDGNVLQVMEKPAGAYAGMHVSFYDLNDGLRPIECGVVELPRGVGAVTKTAGPMSPAATRREYGKFRPIDKPAVNLYDLLTQNPDSVAVLQPRFVHDNLLQCQNESYPGYSGWHTPTYLALGKCKVGGKEVLLLGVKGAKGRDEIYALVNDGTSRYPRMIVLYSGKVHDGSRPVVTRNFQILGDRIIVKQPEWIAEAMNITTFDYNF